MIRNNTPRNMRSYCVTATLRCSQVVDSRSSMKTPPLTQPKLFAMSLLALAASCSSSDRTADEKLAQTTQKLVEPGLNNSVTPGKFAVDPTVAFNLGDIPVPEGVPDDFEHGHVYFSAFTVNPTATDPQSRHAMGFATGLTAGDFYGGFPAADAKVTWFPKYPTGSFAKALPVGKPDAAVQPTGCDSSVKDSCIWGVYGPRPVALRGVEPNHFVMIAQISNKANPTNYQDLALLLSVNSGQTFNDSAHPPIRITIPKVNHLGPDEVSGVEGPTGGPIRWFSAAVTDNSQRIWVYWEAGTSTPKAYVRALDWNGTNYVPASVPGLDEPFRAPGSGLGMTVVGEHAKIAVARMTGPGGPGLIEDYRIALIGTLFDQRYDAVNPLTPTTLTATTGEIMDDDDPCPHAPMAAKIRHRIYIGDFIGSTARHFWKHNEFGDSPILPYCIADGRHSVTTMMGSTEVNPNARLHFEPSVIAHQPPGGEESLLDVAVVEGDQLGNPLGVLDQNEPPQTKVVVYRLRVRATAEPSGGTAPADVTTDEAWTDPTRPEFNSVDYRERINDQWSPALAANGSEQVFLVFHDARYNDFCEDRFFEDGVKRFKYAAVRTADRLPAAGWQIRDGSVAPPCRAPGSSAISPSLISTAPPNSVPWFMRAPQGHGSAAVFNDLRAQFLALWPDNRITDAGICTPPSEEQTEIMSSPGRSM